MSRLARGRGFVYSTSKPTTAASQQSRKRKRSPGSAVSYVQEAAAGSTATGVHSSSRGTASKVQRTEPDFDDDDFDDFGTAALDQYELTQHPNIDTAAPVNPTTSTHAPTTSYTSRQTTSNPTVGPSNTESFEQAMDRLREENFTKDGEVKVLRSENERLLGEIRKREQQMFEIETRLKTENKERETQLTKENNSLNVKLQFKEQEIASLQDKCLLLEQHSKSPGTRKPVPTTKSIKPSSSRGSSSSFFSSDAFMPSSQMNDQDITSVHVKPKRVTRERSSSVSEKKPDVKTKKVRVSRSPTTTPSDSGRRSSKAASKSVSPSLKPPAVTTVDPSMILSVQSRDLDNTQLLMLLIRRDLLKPPIFAATEEGEELEPPPPAVVSDKDSQSSDEDSPQSGSESTQTSLSGLLSLLRVQPKSRPSSSIYATPARALDLSLKDSSSLDSSPSLATPVRQKRLQLRPKLHTLARTDIAKSRLEQAGSSLIQSHSLSASNSPINVTQDKRNSSLLYSVDKSGLEKSIGALLQSADLSSVSRAGTTLSATSFYLNKLYSRMPENSNVDLLNRIATIVLQYHSEQSIKAKGSGNTSITEIPDSSDSSTSTLSNKSISSSGSSKTSSDLFSPLKCDQRLASQSLEILETLVSYSQSVRDQVLLQPPNFILDSRPGSSLRMHESNDSSNLSTADVDRRDQRKTLLSVDLTEVSRRLSFMREGSSAPASPSAGTKDYNHPMEGKVWKDQQLSNIRQPCCNLSANTWIAKENVPQRSKQQEMSFSLPESLARISNNGGLFSALLELPAPPWRESTKNIVMCLKILTALSGDCSFETLSQFAPLLEDDAIGVCLDKDDPQIVQSTLSLLIHLVRSPVIVSLLCHGAPCIPVSCYDICLQTLPDAAHRHSGYNNQLQIVRLISDVLVAEAGASVLLTSSCQCTHELLKTLVLLLSNLVDNVHETSQWTQQELTLVLEVVSLMHKISVHDNYFDSHMMECEHTYMSVLDTLNWLLGTHHTPLKEVTMVNDLLEYAEDLEDSEEQDKMDTN